MDGVLLQIGEVAERTDLSLRTIRYYEEMGLVAPSGRTVGGFRLYTEADVDRLELVKGLKVLDLPLETTRQMLDARDRLAAGVADQGSDIEHLATYAEAAEERIEKLTMRLGAAREAVRELRADVRRSRRRLMGGSAGGVGSPPAN